MVTEYHWTGTDPASTERLRLTNGGSLLARSEVDRSGTRYRYEVRLDSDWTFRSLRIAMIGGCAVTLEHSAECGWVVDGTVRDDLDGAVDIDLVVSPFTNTLPLRRLGLEVGASAEVVVAWVDDDLNVLPDPQRYTRLGADRVLFESLDSGFSRELLVDPDAFVVDYPGLFHRTGYRPVR
ncbi:putative glycolipid-binding domain-containing protein [Herbiconiux sp. L3-i23]|uniref:putative glycolipid-binding domain-containing protein n=1 Tax=Herbiconiux sp. L3-i23 TaxID=2905871 RepID=UPI0020648D63|nr:putative glycolipid-binding domain-containing protein [Herbiconiux sp. L3-i23]BDI22504.1 hypothetical protein L3i23_12800 [Herbiconiux sp. L3-i23]